MEHSTSTSISKARSPSPEANERKGTRGSVSEWSELSSIQEDEEENGDETRHLLSHLSPSLREKVLQVQSASDEDDLRLFAKYCVIATHCCLMYCWFLDCAAISTVSITWKRLCTTRTSRGHSC